MSDLTTSARRKRRQLCRHGRPFGHFKPLQSSLTQLVEPHSESAEQVRLKQLGRVDARTFVRGVRFLKSEKLAASWFVVPVAEPRGVRRRTLGVGVTKAPVRGDALAGRVVDREVLAWSVDRQHGADAVLLIDVGQTATEVDGRLEQLLKPRQILLQHHEREHKCIRPATTAMKNNRHLSSLTGK